MAAWYLGRQFENNSRKHTVGLGSARGCRYEIDWQFSNRRIVPAESGRRAKSFIQYVGLYLNIVTSLVVIYVVRHWLVLLFFRNPIVLRGKDDSTNRDGDRRGDDNLTGPCYRSHRNGIKQRVHHHILLSI